MKIWVADDEEDMRFAMKYFVKSCFEKEYPDLIIELETFGDALQVKTALTIKRPPDMLITDFQMGVGENGLQLAEYVKDNFPNTKIVIMTGNSEKAEEAKKSGLAKVLLKPFLREEFLEIIKT